MPPSFRAALRSLFLIRLWRHAVQKRSMPNAITRVKRCVVPCCGKSCNNWRGVTMRTFSHAAVNNPGLNGVGGRHRSFLFVSCNSFHCESANSVLGAGLAPFASLSCWSNVFLITAGPVRGDHKVLVIWWPFRSCPFGLLQGHSRAFELYSLFAICT